MPYIDDITVFDTNTARVNCTRDVAEHALTEANLETEANKRISARPERYNLAIGLAWWKEGVLTVKPSRLQTFRPHESDCLLTAFKPFGGAKSCRSLVLGSALAASCLFGPL